MRIFKRKRDGKPTKYYWASWTENGKTRLASTGKSDRKAAELWAAEMERKNADPAYRASKEMTLLDAVKSFLEERKNRGKAAGTFRMYSQKCAAWINHLGKDFPLVNITAEVVDQFIAARRAPTDTRPKGCTSNTIHKELVAMRGVLRLARRRGHYHLDPRDVMPVGFAVEYVPRDRCLTFEEARKLIGEFASPSSTRCRPAPHRAAQVAFILCTATRLSEMLYQQRFHVSLTSWTVHVDGTKTSTSKADIPVPEFARPLLEYAVSRATSREGGRYMFPKWGNVRRDLRAACKRAGIPPCSPNDLRRTMATWLAQAGVPLELVARMLRHADTRMVYRVYAKYSKESLGNLVGRHTSDLPAMAAPGAALVVANRSQTEINAG